MLEITIPEVEMYNPISETFEYSAEITLTLEHSLLSISKWEAKWNESLLETVENGSFSSEKFIDYVRCMTVGKIPDEKVYMSLTNDNVKQIVEYMNAPMTATTIAKSNRRTPKRRVITSELIYYWMIASGIPFECQKWHINRLLTLIQVCSAENSPKKKMRRKDILNSYVEQNAKRKAALNTRG